MNKERIFWIVLLALLFIYISMDSKILNKPLYVDIIFYLISLGMTLLFICWKKSKLLYTKNKVELFVSIPIVLVVSFIGKGLLEIPFNFLVKTYSTTNRIEFFEVPIDYVSRNRHNKVAFSFKDDFHSVYFEGVPMDFEKNKDKYRLIITAKKSLFDMYYMQELKLITK